MVVINNITIIIKRCTKCDDYTQMIIDGKIVLKGDYYHDKINDQIDGFIQGLKYCGKNVETLKEKHICHFCED